MLTVASDYMVAELGGTCTGIENFPLVDKDECMKASTSLYTNWKGEEEEASFPRGCYFIPDLGVYWNIHKTGKTRGHCAAICRKSRNDS